MFCTLIQSHSNNQMWELLLIMVISSSSPSTKTTIIFSFEIHTFIGLLWDWFKEISVAVERFGTSKGEADFYVLRGKFPLQEDPIARVMLQLEETKLVSAWWSVESDNVKSVLLDPLVHCHCLTGITTCFHGGCILMFVSQCWKV